MAKARDDRATHLSGLAGIGRPCASHHGVRQVLVVPQDVDPASAVLARHRHVCPQVTGQHRVEAVTGDPLHSLAHLAEVAPVGVDAGGGVNELVSRMACDPLAEALADEHARPAEDAHEIPIRVALAVDTHENIVLRPACLGPHGRWVEERRDVGNEELICVVTQQVQDFPASLLCSHFVVSLPEAACVGCDEKGTGAILVIVELVPHDADQLGDALLV